MFDRKYKVKKTEDGVGTVDVFVYLTHTERKYISAGRCKRSEFEEYSKRKEVLQLVHRCEKVIAALPVLNLEVNVDNFNAYFYDEEEKEKQAAGAKNLYKGVDQDTDFIAYFQKTVDEEDIKPDTRRQKQVTVNALKRFGKIKTFKDLTPANIAGFDKWLHDGTRSDVGIYTYHKHFRKLTRLMTLMEMIPSNPYNHVPVKRSKCKDRKPLTEEEIKKIRDLKLDGAHDDKLVKVRDLFIFAAYTGLAYCDTQLFDFKTMAVKHGDMYYIDGMRVKTQGAFFTPILTPALEVLKKYGYKLPHISNQKANDYLHLIQEKAGITKNVTFHLGRHSFATLVLSHHIPMENLARMLGHKDIRVTQIYGKILDENITNKSEELNNEII